MTLDVLRHQDGAGDVGDHRVRPAPTPALAAASPTRSGPLATQTLTFDPTTGQLDTLSPSRLVIHDSERRRPSRWTCRSRASSPPTTRVLDAAVNGNAPSEVERVEIADDGTLFAVFENGARVPTYRIPLADVPSPDNLQPLAGNVYRAGVDSGDCRSASPARAASARMVSSALEQSTVDLASELTAMIESERNYTANSKVFQTGSELMDVLVNLKR